MKILYTANDRHDAQQAANAVHGLADEVRVIWAGSLWDASRWLSENRDAAAIVVEAEVQHQGCASLVRHVRTLGFSIPILVVVPEASALPVAVLEAGADEFLVSSPSLFSNLATSLGRVLQRQQADQRLQDLTADHERLREHDARLQAALAAHVRSHDALERQLKDGAQARQKLDARLADALTLLQQRDADVEMTAARLGTCEAELAEAVAARRALEQREARLEAALQDLVRRSAGDLRAATQQAAERQAELESALAERVARCEALDGDLIVVRAELERTHARLHDAEQHHLSAMTSAAEAERQAAQHQAELESAIAREMAGRHAAEEDLATFRQRLEDSQSALRDAEQRHAAALTAAEAELTARQAEHDVRLAEAAGARALVDEQLREVEASLERVRHERSADAADAAARVARLEAEAIELRAAGERNEAERIAAEQQAARRESELEAAIAQEIAARGSVEQELVASGQKLTEHESARREAEERHSAELLAVEASLERVRHERSADAADAAARVARLEAEATELRAAGERNEAERIAAEQQAARRESELEAAIAQEIAARGSVEQELAASCQRHSAELLAAEAAHAALEQTIANLERQHASSVDAAAAQLAAQQRQSEARLAEATAAREAVEQQLRDAEATLVRIQHERELTDAAVAERLARRESELSAAAAVRLALEQRLVEAETTLAQARERALAERTAAAKQAAKRQAEFDAQLAREVDARNEVERDLAETRTASHEQFQNLSSALDQVRADGAHAMERLTNDHAAEVSRLETQLAERDAQLKDEAERHLAAQHAAQQALTALESELRSALAARSRQVDELNGELQALTRELQAARNHRDALELEAHRAPELARQLGASRAQGRRQFEQSPVNILRCSHEGALQEANHALRSALGYRTVDELRAGGFPASVFESAEDLGWLIQRCKNGPRQAGDCILKKKDGSRLSMRLHAAQVSTDTIEIVAEDLTSLRATEDRLREAHRMEAVGRLASEIADTCDNLLRDVSRNGHQLLAALREDSTLRHQGVAIFGDVTRAAGFLRQLSAYAHKQARAVSPVDVDKVLRDLEPVLKRVAGDDIELVLPKKVAPLHVDVDGERVERVLVNVAAYGRARMPSGGRLIVELARVAVDRSFVTKYPNVREGRHALIRVTEVRAADRTEQPIGLRDAPPSAESRPTSDGPGVDLGALQTLIGNCGGHLWMNAEPGGDMEVKIRLPLHRPKPGEPQARSGGGRALARWLRS